VEKNSGKREVTAGARGGTVVGFFSIFLFDIWHDRWHRGGIIFYFSFCHPGVVGLGQVGREKNRQLMALSQMCGGNSL
jgi:hypothetical protein